MAWQSILSLWRKFNFTHWTETSSESQKVRFYAVMYSEFFWGANWCTHETHKGVSVVGVRGGGGILSPGGWFL